MYKTHHKICSCFLVPRFIKFIFMYKMHPFLWCSILGQKSASYTRDGTVTHLLLRLSQISLMLELFCQDNPQTVTRKPLGAEQTYVCTFAFRIQTSNSLFFLRLHAHIDQGRNRGGGGEGGRASPPQLPPVFFANKFCLFLTSRLYCAGGMTAGFL